MIAVARCADCGREIGSRPITNWHRLHLPTNPWADLVALADAHCATCAPVAELPADATAREALQLIAAWSRRYGTDCGGLMGLGAAVRKLLPANDPLTRRKEAP